MDKVRYQEMLPHEIVDRREQFPVAFVGLGVLEWHGEHLAVGNDALKADKLCELAAARSGGFAFPTLWYGEPRITRLMEANNDEKDKIQSKMRFQKRKLSSSYFGKSAKEQIKFYQELLYHLLVQLNTLEMKAVCLLCGHYPIRDWASPVVEKFNKAFEDTRVFAGAEFDYCPPNPNVGPDHAALWETSYLWYLRPDCVDISVYFDRPQEPLIGVMGTDPRGKACIEIGQKGCKLIVEGMVHQAKKLLKKIK